LPQTFSDLDVVCGGPADQAKAALIAAGLIQEVPNLGCRYQPTGVAWRAHLRAEQQRHTDALAAQRALRQLWQHSAFDHRQFAWIADVPGLLEGDAAA
jgi:hypothetical protein